MLQEMNKEDASTSLGCLRFPKLQIFVEIFRTNLQSPVCTAILVQLGKPIWQPENSGTYFAQRMATDYLY